MPASGAALVPFDAGEKGDGILAQIYGTQLSHDNKEKFLEYLKTL